MLVVLVIEVAVAVFLFNYTIIGKQAKMLGSNKIAASQSGVSMVKTRIMCYVIAGICFVIAAIFQMGYTGSAS